MTPEELIEELRKQGHFVLLTISPKDLIEYCEDEEVTPSPDEALAAVKFVAEHWDCGDDFIHAMDWSVARVKADRYQP